MPLEFNKISEELFQNFYDKFSENKTFLQTSNYAEFQKRLGKTIFLYGIFKKEELIGTALIQKIQTRLKTFLHCPHCPLIRKDNSLSKTEQFNFFLEKYKTLGNTQRCDFVRISPLITLEEKPLITLLKTNKFRPAPIHLVNPEKTWVLNLEQTEEEIFKNMKKTTRYEIRRQKKFNIEVLSGNTDKDLDIFWNLHTKTVQRQGFIPFPKDSTATQLKSFKKNCLIFNGKINQEFYSSAIIIFDKHTAYYQQGASKHCKFPVSHAVLWEAIREAKKRGCKKFNFWGICDKDQITHPWYGLSKFKRGFGGKEENFLHCQDFPITFKYWINFYIEKYRKWKRNY
ncbi:peptidoglycan bridge formation glycyltransferase FemA/FemB family protein [Candidatus Gracilibacteria bacterium]|nr:peptidoglycan bridge formation glycyltransferase FemA/FemB family protein [Candidatus Gracilibacteria bacterium]